MTPTPLKNAVSAKSLPNARLEGEHAAPGDKSISHRALILGALARGDTRITGLLESEDVLATAAAMQALGAGVVRTGMGLWTVQGKAGQLEDAVHTLDFGNSGTGVRLTMGAVAGAGASARFTGDDSLTSRPMNRVLDPLSLMGAKAVSDTGRLPVQLSAHSLTGIDYTPPMASAQVKSAILLAGLGAAGETIVREPQRTRDHTETMLKLFGADVCVVEAGPGWIITLAGPQMLTGTQIDVPGDPSSAAFATIAALICPGSTLTLTGLMTNPARTGLYRVLERMGARLSWTQTGRAAGEETANLHIHASALTAIDLEAEIAPSLIDEYPILAVAAAFARGTTRLRGLAELRAKESDRLAATHQILVRNGVSALIEGDDLIIEGGQPAGGGHVETHGDHRIAMASLVLGLAARQPVSVDQPAMIATSYPDFVSDMTRMGAGIELSE